MVQLNVRNNGIWKYKSRGRSISFKLILDLIEIFLQYVSFNSVESIDLNILPMPFELLNTIKGFHKDTIQISKLKC